MAVAVVLALTAACSSGDGGGNGIEPPVLDGVALTPDLVTLEPGASLQFRAVGHFTDGATATVPVSWSATGGTITADGLFTAGPTVGAWRVVVATEDGAYADTASVTITAAPPSLTAVEVTPPAASTVTGGTVQFTALGRLSDGSATAVAVTWSATGGTVSEGLYTAGGTPGAYRVVAAQVGGALADTAEVTVTAPPVTLVSLRIAPDSIRIKPYDSVHVTATGSYSDGSTAPVPVTWSSTAGTVSALGNFVAGVNTGRFTLVATQQGGTIADTIRVNVHQTTGESVVGPIFWEAEQGKVYLCTSNQFTDDPVGLGATVAVTATGEGVTAPSVTVSTLGYGSYTSAGTEDYVKVVCEQVWQAPAGLVGTVDVTLTITPARPGTGLANMFTYENPDPYSRTPGRGAFTQIHNWYAPAWNPNPFGTTVTVSATHGANVWYKVTYLP